MGDGGGGHWLIRMEWRPAWWSVCLPLLIFPCTMKSRSSLLAPAHPGGPGKRAVKWLCVCVWCHLILEDSTKHWLVMSASIHSAGSRPCGVSRWIGKGWGQCIFPGWDESFEIHSVLWHCWVGNLGRARGMQKCYKWSQPQLSLKIFSIHSVLYVSSVVVAAAEWVHVYQRQQRFVWCELLSLYKTLHL